MATIDERLASAIDILDALVAFDTTSHKSNAALVSYVADYLRRHGIEPILLPEATGEKFNMAASIGPLSAGGGVGLSGHTDVVPVTGQDWHTDPFRLTRRDDRLHGRGTTDMKGYLACVLAMVPRFVACGLKRPIHLFFSYDEEIGCVGVRPMLARLGEDVPAPDIVLVGEPTGMAVVDAHKGPARWNVTVTGRAAHSSMSHLGVNAVEVAADLIGELTRIAADLRESHRDDRFDPPYATLQVTGIEGGTATNIVPVSCWFRFEVRTLPGVDIEALERRLAAYAADRLPALREVAEEAAIDIELVNYVPPYGARAGSSAVALAQHLVATNELCAVSYATEAGLFQSAGADAVVCGPGHIAQAHTANEWIEVSELSRCLEVLDRLADWSSR